MRTTLIFPVVPLVLKAWPTLGCHSLVRMNGTQTPFLHMLLSTEPTVVHSFTSCSRFKMVISYVVIINNCYI